MPNSNTKSVLPEIRRACDQAVFSHFPSSLVSTSFVDDTAGTSDYSRLCQASSDKLIIYLHTWSSDKHQLLPGTPYTYVTAFPNTAVVCPNYGGAFNNSYALSDAALADIMTVITEMRYKTGLSRVYLIGASGGATAGLCFMGKYPGVVHRASLWLPTYNLAQQYLDLQISDPTDTQGLQANMRAIFGHAPSGPSDADYLARSPCNRLTAIYGPTSIYINSGSADTIALPAYASSCATLINNVSSDCKVTLTNWSGMGHTFGTANDCLDAMKQLILE